MNRLRQQTVFQVLRTPVISRGGFGTRIAVRRPRVNRSALDRPEIDTTSAPDRIVKCVMMTSE